MGNRCGKGGGFLLILGSVRGIEKECVETLSCDWR